MQIGIDLGGSHIAVAVISENGKIATKKEQDLKIMQDGISYSASIKRSRSSTLCLK